MVEIMPVVRVLVFTPMAVFLPVIVVCIVAHVVHLAPYRFSMEEQVVHKAHTMVLVATAVEDVEATTVVVEAEASLVVAVVQATAMEAVVAAHTTLEPTHPLLLEIVGMVL